MCVYGWVWMQSVNEIFCFDTHKLIYTASLNLENSPRLTVEVLILSFVYYNVKTVLHYIMFTV